MKSLSKTTADCAAQLDQRACRNVMIAFVLSLVAGIGLAFLLDFLDDTVKSIDDIDRYIHLPALAMIPAGRVSGD